MEDVKEQGKEWVRKQIEKTQNWLSKFLTETDLKLSKVQHFLSATKEEFQRYIEDRNALVIQMDRKEKEINQLSEKMLKIKLDKSEKYQKLYNSLESKVDELFTYRSQIQSMEIQIENYRNRVKDIEDIKGKVINERDDLKASYDHLSGKIQSYKEEKEALLKDIQELKDSKASGSTIDEKEKLLQKVETAKEETEVELKHEKAKLLTKVKEMADLNSEYHDLKNSLIDKEHQLEKNAATIQNLEKDLNSIKADASDLEKEKLQNQEEIDFYVTEHSRKEAELRNLKQKKFQMEEKMNKDFIDRQNEVDILEEEIREYQGKLAIAEAEKQELSEEDKQKHKILQTEYEPRFRVLYRQSEFRNEFLDDFYTLSPSDRLKVEACIVDLNYNYDLNRSKVRPNSVSTSSLRLNEYPFANTGRIYFCKENGKVQFYRLSRTKNGRGRLDQQKVITWIKKKL